MVKTNGVNLWKSKNSKTGENKTSNMTTIAAIRFNVFFNKIRS